MMASMFIIKNIQKTKYNLLRKKLQNFMVKKILRLTLTMAVIIHKLFFKKCKYIVKKVIWYINENLSDFSSDGKSYEE